MESSEPTATDPEKKSRSRVFGRIAIWVAVLFVCFGGLVIWDQHDYPIPYVLEQDPFAPFPPSPSLLLERSRLALGGFQRNLRQKRNARIHRGKLKKLVFSESTWKTQPSFGITTFTSEIHVYFNPDGSLEFQFKGQPSPIQDFLKFDRYERPSFNTLILMNNDKSESLEIFCTIDRNNVGLFNHSTGQNYSLIPVEEKVP
ncbi:hypothetical protein OAE61_00240 [Verrucomicrobiales bacterium]|nr:hypothetical protein [Verrucomicrobiales bacterium]MDC0258618.1 hypothetical protein [Verrucomicrobiales bacterium]